MIALDNRLLCVARLVTIGGKTCDVGTDHAYLPAYLIENGISKACIACDIADGPLEFARHTVKTAKLEEEIEVVKSNGLDEISSTGITDVTLCGMGGELIADIISRADWLKNDVNIVVQPMTKADWLRKWLYANGFEICEELACSDDRFVYAVMQVKYNGVCVELDDYSATVGRLKFSDDEAVKYLRFKVNQLRKISDEMALSSAKMADCQRFKCLADEIENDIAKGGRCKCCTN